MAASRVSREIWTKPVHPELDEASDLEDVPAAVVCAYCGRADCAGCGSNVDEPTHASKVVAIVPWERPRLRVSERLWATAKLATISADSFFGALPEGEILPAARFAVAAELCAVTGLCLAALPFLVALVPTLLEAVWLDEPTRQAAMGILGIGIPAVSALMVMLHAVHGAGLDLGVRKSGGRGRRDRGLRFGFYSCGWDLVTLPLGLAILLVTDGMMAAVRAVPLGLTVPGRATRAYLRRVHGLDDARARRVTRFAGRVASGLLLVLMAGALALVLSAARASG